MIARPTQAQRAAELRRRVREARKAKQIGSQNELARQAGIACGYLSMILHAKRRPSWPLAVKLQSRTGIEATAFMEVQS